MGLRDRRPHRTVIALWILAACGRSDAEATLEGQCEEIRDNATRNACMATRGSCDSLVGAAHDECIFRAAEAAGDAKMCRDAGAFADDCRLHLFSAGFARWAPSDPTAGRDEAMVEPHILDAGLAVDDPRPWSAWYRHVLSARRPIDRAGCTAIPLELRREACLHTGIALYNDLLNMARDKKLYPCDGGALPEVLTTTPDPELDAVRAARKDLCTSSHP